MIKNANIKILFKNKKASFILSFIILILGLSIGLGVGLGVGLSGNPSNNNISRQNFDITTDNTKMFVIDPTTGTNFSGALFFPKIDGGVSITFTATDDNPNGNPAYFAPRFSLSNGILQLSEFNNSSYSIFGDFDSNSNGQSIGTFNYPGIGEVPSPDYSVDNLLLLSKMPRYFRTTIFDAQTPIGVGDALYFPINPITSDGLSLIWLVLFIGINPTSEQPFIGQSLTSANLPI